MQLNTTLSVSRTQIINMLNIKAVHHLLSCPTEGNHGGNPYACGFFQILHDFLYRDAFFPPELEENCKNLQGNHPGRVVQQHLQAEGRQLDVVYPE